MSVQRIGRYELLRPIASGGMATVHLGRVLGAGGFQRLVAIKAMHPHIASDPEFVAMFLDEARLAAGIRHPNVVATLDIEQGSEGLFLVMEYVEGSSAHILVKALRQSGQRLPIAVVLRIVLDSLAGLHAAHDLRGGDGRLLGLVHRDVSPQNVLVGVDGVSRITDFGVARAEARMSSTRGSQVKGKVPYMSPEQLRAEDIDCRSDVYAMGVVLWEMLTGRRLFKAPSDGALVAQVMAGVPQGPRAVEATTPTEIDAVCMRALAPRPEQRYNTAADFADALEHAAERARTPIGTSRAVGRFVAETLERAGLHPLPENLGGAGVAPKGDAPALQSNPSAPSSALSAAALPPTGPRAPEPSSAVSRVGPGHGSSATAVAVAASPLASRASAVGLGAAIGGVVGVLLLVGVVVFVVLNRAGPGTEVAAPAAAPTAGPTVPPPPALEPAPTAETVPLEALPVMDAAAEESVDASSAKPSVTARGPAVAPPRPKPAPKPGGGEFQPDRL